jgi:hypothetical protein
MLNYTCDQADKFLSFVGDAEYLGKTNPAAYYKPNFNSVEPYHHTMKFAPESDF